jgi:hypothetical protein
VQATRRPASSIDGWFVAGTKSDLVGQLTGSTLEARQQADRIRRTFVKNG